MITRSPKIFFEDILESVNKIERYIKNLSHEGFIKDEMIIDAVLRNLGVIGEAAKNIPDKIKRKHQNVPWKRMIGLGIFSYMNTLD